MDVQPVLAEAGRAFPETVERLKQFLRFPSIATDPAYHAASKDCAAWLAAELAGMGFEAGVRATPGMPMVVAHHPGPGGEVPHLLYYGHYDVQPVDPVELWDTPPFEPTVVEHPRGPRIVARGAVDDKGQVMTFVEAFRAWLAVHGTLPCRVTVFVEGEEEGSSPSLEPFMRANQAELGAADVCVVSDTGMIDPDTPAITTSLRGMAYVEVTVQGPDQDLHSGMYGGVAVNPNNLLVKILAQLHDEAGRVTIPGFYDGIEEPSDAVKASWEGFPISEAQFLGQVGLKGPHGEQGRSYLERVWTRPTLDINGIQGGYVGEGAKTVIPSKAMAKISTRLVPGQDWERIAPAIAAFVQERLPPDCTMDWKHFGSAPGITVPTEGPFVAAAREGIALVFGREPILMGCGGSIPVVGSFKEILGLDTLLVGFGLDDDRVHSPNEKFDLACLEKGVLTHVAMLDRFAGVRR